MALDVFDLSCQPDDTATERSSVSMSVVRAEAVGGELATILPEFVGDGSGGGPKQLRSIATTISLPSQIPIMHAAPKGETDCRATFDGTEPINRCPGLISTR